MEKWVRRSVQAALTAGVVSVGAVGGVQAQTVDSEAVAAMGSNGILSGNAVSAPVVASVIGNQIAASVLGNSTNVGGSHCGPTVNSSAFAVGGDNLIGSANAISAPVVAAIIGNQVAASVVGNATNIGGEGCEPGGNGNGNGGNGNGNGGYSAGTFAENAFAESNYGESDYGDNGDRGDGGCPSSTASAVSGNNTIGSGNAISIPVCLTVMDNQVGASIVGDTTNVGTLTNSLLGSTLGSVASLAGMPASEHGLADVELHDDGPDVHSATTAVSGNNTIGSGNSISIPVVVNVSDNQVGVSGVGNTTNVPGDGDGDAPEVHSATTAVSGNNTIGSGNSISIPIVADVSDNQVGVSGVGNTTNLGSSGGGGNGPAVNSDAAAVSGNNSILSGNAVSIPIVANVSGNQVGASGVGNTTNVGQGAGGGVLGDGGGDLLGGLLGEGSLLGGLL